MLAWYTVACVRPEPADPPAQVGDSAETEPEPVDSGAPTTDSATDPVDPDCLAALPLGPLQVIEIPGILTEEDFDFDADGRLVAQRENVLVGYTRNGDSSTLAANLGNDIEGVRTLTTGDFVVAAPDVGLVRLVDAASGALTNVASGLVWPNGLEVGIDDLVYVSQLTDQGGISTFDPYDRVGEPLLSGTAVNGLALSPDEQTLYFSSFDYQGQGRFSGISKLERQSGGWGSPEPVFEAQTLLQGLTTDKCGNLYAIGSTSRKLLRYNLADGTVDELATVGRQGEFLSGARFGAGFGGWERNMLYVTPASVSVYVIDVGIDGRHVLAD